MSEHNIPPLAEDVLDVLESGRKPSAIDANAQDAVWQRIERSIDLPPLPDGDPTQAVRAASKIAISKIGMSALLAATTGLGAVLGASVISYVQPPRVERVEVERVVYRDRVVEVPVERTVLVPAPAAEVHASNSTRPSENSARGVNTESTTVAAREDTRTAERALISQAQNALTRGRFAAALVALETHETQFARGWLEEEREALRVQALEGLDRHDEARERAAMFITAHPRSLFRSLVERAVDGP